VGCRDGQRWGACKPGSFSRRGFFPGTVSTLVYRGCGSALEREITSLRVLAWVYQNDGFCCIFGRLRKRKWGRLRKHLDGGPRLCGLSQALHGGRPSRNSRSLAPDANALRSDGKAYSYSRMETPKGCMRAGHTRCHRRFLIHWFGRFHASALRIAGK